DAATDCPLWSELWQGSSDLVTVNTITAKIRPPALRVLDATPGDNAFDQRGDVADLVILFCPTDIERLVMNQLPRRLKDGQERATNISHVNERPPGRAIARDQDLSRGVSKTNETVYHQIGAKPGRDSVSRGIA